MPHAGREARTLVARPIGPPAGSAHDEDDWATSPYTGWTRAHWEQLADSLLANAERHSTRKGAGVAFPGGRRGGAGSDSDALEGFARTFLLAAFRLAGSGGGVAGSLTERYARGLTVGTDPSQRLAWPRITDCSQALAESTSIAIALHESRPWIWDELPDPVRQRCVDWLQGALKARCHPNNWLWFSLIVSVFLKSVGAPYHQRVIDDHLQQIETLYVRDGWYTDGPGASFDHYNALAFHFYPFFWERMDPGSEPSLATSFRTRLCQILDDLQHLYGSNGAPMYHGRSLTYRFGVVAPFWIGEHTRHTPLSSGLTRRLASGAVKYFVERGATSAGHLSMGWHDEFLASTQRYSGVASPYWASKAFVGLLLPPDAPAWTCVEEPLPVERGDFCRPMPAAGFLAVGSRSDGIVRMASHRSDRYPSDTRGADPHYNRLAYSTHCGPELVAGGAGAARDSQVRLILDGGARTDRVRVHTTAVGPWFAASVHFPFEVSPRRSARRSRTLARLEALPVRARRVARFPWLAPVAVQPEWVPRIETVAIMLGRAEIRLDHITLGEPARAEVGGYAIAADEPLHSRVGGVWSAARSPQLTSFAGSLQGFSVADVQPMVGANPYGRHSGTPYLRTAELARGEHVLISLIALTGAELDPDSEIGRIRETLVGTRGVVISCEDGVRLGIGFKGASAPAPHAGSSSGPLPRYWREIEGQVTDVVL